MFLTSCMAQMPTATPTVAKSGYTYKIELKKMREAYTEKPGLDW